MYKYKVWVGLVLLFITLFSCAPEAKNKSSEPKDTGVQVSAPAAKADWEVQWDNILKEARKEGTVVLYGSPVAETRQAFVETFQKTYPGITLEYTAMLTSLAAPKIKAERKAGIYGVDLVTGGTNTILSDLRDFAVPIKPLLILPDVKDPKQWFDGRLDFADNKEEVNLVYTINVSSRVVYNSDQVGPSDLGSWWDLTNSKWRGKILMRDPRVAGQGNATATFWLLESKLGIDFIKALAANKPMLSRDPTFEAEAVARGKYSIGISLDPPTVVKFMKAGLPITYTPVLKEGTYSSSATGSVIVMDKAPHPQAATVFLNWMLGKEGQTLWTLTSGYASRRLDAPVDHLLKAEKPVQGSAYSPNYKEDIAMKKDEVAKVVTEIFTGF